jgi:hypothetical protein
MAFSPVPAREHAIVWEVRPEEARGALFDFGMEQRILLRRTWRALRGEPLPSFFKLKQFRKVPVVISLHPALARTFILPFHLSRKKGEGPIRPEGLQSMLREFLSKTTFEMRRIAATALGVEELDAIVIDARLTRVLADGVEVRDDRAIEGRSIDGFMRVTLTTRAVFHDLHDLLHSGRELFFTESGPAALAFMGRNIQGPLMLLDLEPEGGWLFRVDYDSDEIVKKTQFRWSADDFPLALVQTWGVSKKTADRIYAMFLREGLSDRASRFASKLFEPIKESFDRTLDKMKAAGVVYLRTVTPLPLDLPSLHGEVKLVDFPMAKMLEASGLNCDLRGGDAAEASLFFMAFLEYYYHRGDPRGHKALTRHIHWISA